MVVPAAALSPALGIVILVGVLFFVLDRRRFRLLAADYSRHAPMVNQVGLAICVGVAIGAPFDGRYGLAVEGLIAGAGIVIVSRLFERRATSHGR